MSRSLHEAWIFHYALNCISCILLPLWYSQYPSFFKNSGATTLAWTDPKMFCIHRGLKIALCISSASCILFFCETYILQSFSKNSGVTASAWTNFKFVSCNNCTLKIALRFEVHCSASRCIAVHPPFLARLIFCNRFQGIPERRRRSEQIWDFCLVLIVFRNSIRVAVCVPRCRVE